MTFYGEIRTLKDLFGEDKLNQLDLTSLEFAFTGTDIYNRITDLTTDYDVRYPLIASNRLWTYHHGSEDITTNSKSIRYNELFPAVKIIRLFDAIANDYGVIFTGTFLSDPRFTNVFLYGKNTNVYSFITESTDVKIDQVISTVIVDSTLPNPADLTYTDIYQDEINVLYAQDVQFSIISFEILNQSTVGTWYIDVFQDGNYYQTIQGTTTGVFGNISFQNISGLNTTLTFKMKANVAMNIDMLINYQITGTNGLSNYAQISTLQTAMSGNVSINSTIPDMKVSDFFTGVLKEFNCTCVATSENVFEILPLEDWYSQGAIVDITQYTDIDSIDIERIKLYKKIAFKYQQSESFVNRNFFKISNSEYGNMEYQFAYDGEEYTIEAPFENLLFTRSIDNANNYAILGYCLNESYNAYTPKPMLLYLYGESNDLSLHCIKFYDGTTHQDIDSFAQLSFSNVW